MSAKSSTSAEGIPEGPDGLERRRIELDEMEHLKQAVLNAVNEEIHQLQS
jgi:hypothetical protein